MLSTKSWLGFGLSHPLFKKNRKEKTDLGHGNVELCMFRKKDFGFPVAWGGT